MKYIQLKYQGKGRRTVNIQAHGFMGPAQSPMGKGPLKVAGEYLKPGTLTTAFTLDIPPSGECQVVDCQHNRELLRKITAPRSLWEDVKKYEKETGKYYTERVEIEHPPAYTVLDATPFHEDIVLSPTVQENNETLKLKRRIAELEGKDPASIKLPNATSDGETSVPPEVDMEVGHKPLSHKELTAKRFSNKIPDPVSLV
jgi:hypothetical protein